MSKQVAIVILTKNNPNIFNKCITSIANHTITTSYKIYVGDTGSDEVNLNIMTCRLKELFDKNTCSLYDLQKYHFAGNNNSIVFNHVNEPYILFCNDDVELQSNCIDEMFNYITTNDHIGSVGCRLLFPDGRVQHAGQIIYKDQTNLLQCTHRGYGTRANYPNQVTTGNTAAFMLTSRDNFISHNGFDESYTECWEDVHLNMRYILSGLKNRYLDNVHATHHESMTRTKTQQALYRLRFDYTYKLKPWFDSLSVDKQQWILSTTTDK